ncbi:FKBP-type peptidyl-prolyl cis-trans isomerase [Atlantibacter subterraneus]|uniref:FKBP-type peptidyl-prolyl cis-trans isomerase n=1 Tax=Atlantibacter subterraneus TaxID=255519 RepID=UPI00296544E5|nr:FKBP-type peptidyl-prolyl cis-trans isomerase [Atlantibacter subterranea]MDW2741820.1 FKBP-type peptidyl-prolyl cis-trans isomerase [Atlantibacter subterranea]
MTPSGKAKNPHRKNVSHPVNPPSQKALQADAASQVAWTQEKAALLKAAAENRNQIEQLQAQLNAANNRAVSGVDQEALKQAEAWKTQLAEMKKNQSAQAAQLAQTQQQLMLSEKVAQGLKDQLAMLSVAKGDNTQQISQLQIALQESQKHMADDQKQIAGLVSDQAAKAKALADLQQQLALSQKQSQEAKAQIATLSDAQDQKVQQMQKALQESQKQAADDQKQIAGLTSEQALSKKAAMETQKVLTESQSKIKALEKQLVDSALAQSVKDKSLQEAQQKLADNQKQSEALTAKWQEASKQLEAQTKQLADLQKAQPEVAKTGKPQTKNEIRDYALGAFWAQEIIGMMKNKEGDGYRIAKQQVLNGMTDELNNQLKLSKEDLVSVLKELDQSSQAKEKSLATEAMSQGNEYLTQFSKKAGVKRASLGYYYLIADKGVGKIASSDTVAVTMRESLTNGKVISDMTKKGTVLALPLSQFPPLFKSAISQVNNRGELRIVVPPELAYGEKGSLPEIPPNSTMIYDIKIIDVTHNPPKKKA